MRREKAMTDNPDVLFQPVTLGDLELRNRIVMAPLTRSRSTQPGDVPNAMNAEYYRQRANAGLIIAEARGYLCTNRWHLWLSGLFTVTTQRRRRADCPSRRCNTERGQTRKPRRAGRQAPICCVAALVKGYGHSLRAAPCICTLGEPAEAPSIRA